MTQVTINYLEMTSAEKHREKAMVSDLQIAEAEIKQARVNQFLYELVGEGWDWNDKAEWTPDMWGSYANADDLRTWIAWSRGSIAGYFELQKQTASDTEIAYFGLAPAFIGQGFGGAMLSHAINCAWQWGDTERLLVNTCSLDHPSALANYQARGFEACRTVVVDK